MSSISTQIIDEFQGKKILITGGAGYLATNVIWQLQDVNCHIVRLDRPEAQFTPVKGKVQIKNISADIRDSSIWEFLLKDIDVIFHFAAQTSVYIANDNPLADIKINVFPMLNILEACRNNGFRPIIIFSGTSTEIGMPLNIPVDETHPDNPITIYDLHKWMSENYLKHYIKDGFVYGAVLRLANVYGPGPRSSSADRGVLNMMVRKALQGDELTIYGDGKFIRDYIYVEDVAVAFLKAAVNINQVNGKHFLIGSGEGNTITDAFHLIGAEVKNKTGKNVKITNIDLPTNLSPIERRNFVANINLFNTATGWLPTVTLKDGISLIIDYYMAEKQ